MKLPGCPNLYHHIQSEGQTPRNEEEPYQLECIHGCGLTIGVNRRYRSGAVKGDEESERLAVQVTRRGSVGLNDWLGDAAV